MSIGPMLRKLWKQFSAKPAGKHIFSRLLGLYVPYSGTIGAYIDTLEPGHSVIILKDRRKVRNHLKSIHAVALANLGEMATGMALLNSLPDQARAILVGLKTEYSKKARGRLRAECHCEIPESSIEAELVILATITDRSGDVVATAEATWKIGPEK